MKIFILILFLCAFLITLSTISGELAQHGNAVFSPKFDLNHGHHKHRLRRAVIKICVDFNRQPIPCKWETEAQLRKKMMACHLSIITMPFCHRTVPKITRKMHKIQ
ncbi:hypothetical protein niasHT_006305 [Heterodera trifolii]|uniref:Uncharacterized protein n=1 Tax=Heterodera trifolii TaxID=157864 RepID=A0ABD2LUW0_9BILA